MTDLKHSSNLFVSLLLIELALAPAACMNARKSTVAENGQEDISAKASRAAWLALAAPIAE